MSTSELLSRLREAGIRLSVKDGQLNVSAPKGALNEELRRSLRDRKAELIELLADADSALYDAKHAGRAQHRFHRAEDRKVLAQGR